MTEETARQLFVVGLRNAHALENEALALINRQLDRVENYPEVLTRLKQHQVETEGQIARLDGIFTSLDESPSTIKDTAMSLMGNMAALGHTMAGDEIIKNSLANFAFENLEIASYKSLITLAGAAGLTAHIAPLRETLAEEQAMAKWLEDNLEKVTLRFVERESQGKTAKV